MLKDVCILWLINLIIFGGEGEILIQAFKVIKLYVVIIIYLKNELLINF